MSDEPIPVTVHILDKEYRVACPPDEREALVASAHHLDQHMREIRDSGRVVGIDRIAVMAALNIAHEMLDQRTQRQHDGEHLAQRIEALAEQIDGNLDEDRQLKL